MKVKELIEILRMENPDAEVVLSKDGEGNDFSPLADYSPGNYEPKTTYSGEFTSDSETALRAVCLWPTN